MEINIRQKINLIKTFFKLSWMGGMEYKINFWTWLLVDCAWAIMNVVFLLVLVGYTKQIGSWNSAQVLFIAGIVRLLTVYVWGWLYQSFQGLPRDISEGRLDLFLTKPVDTQFLISVRKFSINMFPSIALSLFYMFMGYRAGAFVFSVPSFILFLWAFFLSLILIYGVYFLTMTMCLYFERLNNIQFMVAHSLDIAKYPAEIYPNWIRNILMSVLPLVLIIGVPANIVFGQLDWPLFLWFHVLVVIFLALGRFSWHYGLRRYSSASS